MNVLTAALVLLAVGALIGATIWTIVFIVKKIMGFK